MSKRIESLIRQSRRRRDRADGAKSGEPPERRRRWAERLGFSRKRPPTTDPSTGLVLCGAGAFLLACDFDWSFGGWSLAPIRMGAGILLCLLGGALLLARGGLGAPRLLITAFVLFLVGTLIGQLEYWGEDLGELWSRTGSLASIGAVLFFGYILSAHCREKQWAAATRAWTHFWTAACIVYGGAILLFGGLMMWSLSLGEAVVFTSHSFVALTITWALLALPTVLLIRALAFTCRAATDAHSRQPSRALRCASHPAFSFALFLLLLAPIWLLIPSVVYFNTTPMFDEYLADEASSGAGPSREDFLEATTPTSQVLEVATGPDAALGAFSSGAKEQDAKELLANHRWQIEVVRGDMTLLELDHLLVARAVPGDSGQVGIGFKTDRFQHDPRFHVVVRVAVEMPPELSDELRASGYQRSTWWFPFVTNITLVSGPGEDRFELLRVDRLEDSDELVDAAHQRNGSSQAFAPRDMKIDDAESDLLNPDLDPPDVTGPGVRFAWRSQGVLGFSTGDIRGNAEGVLSSRELSRGKSWAQSSFDVNQDEYSYVMNAEQTVQFPWGESEGPGISVLTTAGKKWNRSIERTWNEVLW